MLRTTQQSGKAGDYYS